MAREEVDLRMAFYPLGNDPLVQALSEVDHRVDQACASRVQRVLRGPLPVKINTGTPGAA
jgi:hypothetical protein